MAHQDLRKRLRLVRLDERVPEPATSFLEWCEANGYDPETRTYRCDSVD